MSKIYTTEIGFDLIKRFESFSPVVYSCPAGIATIGYGHIVAKHERFARISMQAAEDLLRQDIAVAEQTVERLITVPLKWYQFDALVSFTFNLGAGALQRSTLRQKINRQEHDLAANEFGKWVYAGGVKLYGLVLRRAAEASLYVLGD